MGLFDRFRRRPEPEQPATPPRRGRRGYEAAAVSRLTQSWAGTLSTIDEDISAGAGRIRARARDLAQNSDFVRRYLGLVERNIVGSKGFRLQSQVTGPGGRPNLTAQQAIEEAWDRWKRAADAAGRLGFDELCRQIVRTVARDGEALILISRGRQAKNEFGFAIRQIDPKRLDITYNQDRIPGRPGNKIIMGVEIDADHRPMAYHIRSKDDTQRARYSADDVIHLYRQTDPEMTRGISWLAPVMTSLHHLKGYQEAAVIASRIGASKMGFYVTPDGAPLAADATDDPGVFIASNEPGEFGVLPAGYDFRQFDPTYPQAQYEMFTKACIREIAAGLDVSYASLSNDLSDVNFSSIRAGLLDERDQWATLQSWFADQFLDPIFDEWLTYALSNHQVVTSSGQRLDHGRLNQYRQHRWYGRRWQWVDPLKDVRANIEAIEAGLISRQEVMSEQGRDVADVFAQLQTENELAEAAGLNLSGEEYPVSELPTD